MLERIFVAPLRARTFRSAVHAATFFAGYGRRLAGRPRTSPRAAARTRQHGAGVALVSADQSRSECLGCRAVEPNPLLRAPCSVCRLAWCPSVLRLGAFRYRATPS